MTAAVLRNTPSLAVPLSQNTAPVLEFNCLYTHDARKKQKKWQDGMLRYHTFNKRVMVYDVSRNLVGDMHWTGEEDVQEGDELTLERGGVRVEVADCIGQTETDLSELRGSKKKADPAARTSAMRSAVVLPQTPNHGPSNNTISKPNTQLKHRSLNTLLGTPKGPIGKAVLPTKSPFEERQAEIENKRWQEGRPPKRARTDDIQSRNVTRPLKPLEPVKKIEDSLGARTADPRKQRPKQAQLLQSQQQLETAEIIDLSSDGPSQTDFLAGFSDDILTDACTPAKESSKVISKAVMSSSSPAFEQNPAPHRQKRRSELGARQPTSIASARRAREVEVDDNGQYMEENFQEAQNYQDVRPSNVRMPIKVKECPQQGLASVTQSSAVRQDPTSSKNAHTFRLAPSIPKKRTLLCQDQLSKKSRRLCSIDTDDAADALLLSTSGGPGERKQLTAQEQLRARLAKIDKKGSSASRARLRKAAATPAITETERYAYVEEDVGEDNLPDGPAMELISDDETSPLQYSAVTKESLAVDVDQSNGGMPPPPKLPYQRSSTPPTTKSTKPFRPETSRSLRRVSSESAVVTPRPKSRRVPGAPVRYTPSPTRGLRESTPATLRDRLDGKSKDHPPAAPASPEPVHQHPGPPVPGPAAVKKPYKHKRGPVQKSVSLNVTASGTSSVILSRPFRAPGARKAVERVSEQQEDNVKDVGPWSREAFDLFAWRPPGWDEDKWCVADGAAALESAGNGDTARCSSGHGGGQGVADSPPPGLSGGVDFPLFSRPVVE
jgi:hypothetical protein